MNLRHLEPEGAERGRHLRADEAPADDDGTPRQAGRIADRGRVGQRAQAEDLVALLARNA